MSERLEIDENLLELDVLDFMTANGRTDGFRLGCLAMMTWKCESLVEAFTVGDRLALICAGARGLFDGRDLFSFSGVWARLSANRRIALNRFTTL